MGRKLKTGKFNNWAPATPDSIGQTVLVVGRERATIGKRKLTQVIFGPRVDGVVKFEKQNELSLCIIFISLFTENGSNYTVIAIGVNFYKAARLEPPNPQFSNS